MPRRVLFTPETSFGLRNVKTVAGGVGDFLHGSHVIASALVMHQTESPPVTTEGQSQAGEKTIRILKLKALNSSDPADQVRIYKQILELNPDDPVANARLPELQEQIDQKKAAEAAKLKEMQAEERKEHQAEITEQDALAKAKQGLLSGNLKTAAAEIAIARGIRPVDPEVQRVDALIQKGTEERQRVRGLLAGGGLLVIIAIAVVYVRKRGQKEPYLEVVGGEEKGKRFMLNENVVRIGAVEQYGNDKNQIVISDSGRTISRFQCVIERNNGRFYVFDCDTPNGTWVDRHRVPPGRPALLKKGSRLDLAEACSLRLRFAKRRKPDST